MNARSRLWIVALFLSQLGAPLTVCGQSLPQNAAVKYLRADIALRESYAFPAAPSTTLQKALDSPLDDNSEKLVAAAREALTEFQHGTELKNCDWELSAQDGPLANTSHREAIRDLVLVSGLRARVRFRDNHPQDAIKDSLAAIAAARQLCLDGSLASVLMSYHLEEQVSQILAHNLSHLSRSELRRLATSLSSLPRGMDMQNALRAEELDRHPLLTVIHGASTRSDLITRLLNGAPVLNGEKRRAEELVDGCGGSVQGFENCIRQQSAFYEHWLSRFSLPPEQFQKDYDRQFSGDAGSNPLILHYTVVLPRLRWAEAYNRTRRRLLEAAIAVQLDGPAALDQFSDGETFVFAPLKHGFCLESELKDDRGPIFLSTEPNP